MVDSAVPPTYRRERENGYQREGQQQVLRATFPGIRDGVRELLGVRADALARKFHETHDMKVKDELERLLKEYGQLKEPWVFVVR
jgi:hypothetical protein